MGLFNAGFILGWLNRRKHHRALTQLLNTAGPHRQGPQEGLWPGAELAQGTRAVLGGRKCPSLRQFRQSSLLRAQVHLTRLFLLMGEEALVHLAPLINPLYCTS